MLRLHVFRFGDILREVGIGTSVGTQQFIVPVADPDLRHGCMMIELLSCSGLQETLYHADRWAESHRPFIRNRQTVSSEIRGPVKRNMHFSAIYCAGDGQTWNFLSRIKALFRQIIAL